MVRLYTCFILQSLWFSVSNFYDLFQVFINHFSGDLITIFILIDNILLPGGVRVIFLFHFYQSCFIFWDGIILLPSQNMEQRIMIVFEVNVS